jgi:hypothetical protein
MTYSTTRKQQRAHRRSEAARAARERAAARPWQRALARTRALVDDGALPPACSHVVETMARCHLEHGKGVQQQWLLIGYGDRGDPRRIEGRRKSTAEPPVHLGIADETQLSRRWAITCVLLLVQAGIVKRWYGGPDTDPRLNTQPVTQRHPTTGEELERVQGLGGSGNANGYTVDGIPDPPEKPRPGPGPAPAEPREEPSGDASRHLEDWRRRRQEHEQERLRRLAADRTRAP